MKYNIDGLNYITQFAKPSFGYTDEHFIINSSLVLLMKQDGLSVENYFG